MHTLTLPKHLVPYYGGKWPRTARRSPRAHLEPGDWRDVVSCRNRDRGDVDAAVAAAREGFREWRNVAPLERARILIRRHGDELAFIDPANCGNPFGEMKGDAFVTARR